MATSLQPEANSWSWPIKGEIDKRLTSLFGESRKDHFHNGVDISSVKEPVYPVRSGKVLYSRFSGDFPFSEDLGTGNSVWLDHGDGILSAYYHLENKRNKILEGNQTVSTEMSLGLSGNTGHSSGGHLHFLTLSENGKKIFDPLSVLPKVQDTIPPDVLNLFLHTKTGFSNLAIGDTIRASQNYPLSVLVQDSGLTKGGRRWVKEISLQWNGNDLRKDSFTWIRYGNGEWFNPEGRSFSEIYFQDRYMVGDMSLRNGENTLVVMATDFHDQKTTKTFSFYVERISEVEAKNMQNKAKNSKIPIKKKGK